MIDAKPRVRLLCFLFCLLATLLATPASALLAAPSLQPGAIDEAGLEVHISFPQDQLLAEWHVHVKRTVGDKLIFEHTKAMPLRCKLYGNVKIQDESALFRAADQSYIACTLPNLRKTVYAMTEDEPGGPIVLNQKCDSKNAWIAAKVRLEAPSTTSGPTRYDNPIFYHPDFQYYIPQVNGSSDPLLHVQHDSVTEPYSSVFQPEPWNVVWTGIDGAEFLDNLGRWGEYLKDYDLSKIELSRHWANGNVLRYANEPSEFQLTTDETEIYIGHSPAAQTYSDIAVKHIDWDPPCFGAGGG